MVQVSTPFIDCHDSHVLTHQLPLFNSASRYRSYAFTSFVFRCWKNGKHHPEVPRKLVVTDDGVFPGGDKRGLTECGDMDRQLAQVASTKFGDVPVGLLDEIFQCVYFSDLLGYRR